VSPQIQGNGKITGPSFCTQASNTASSDTFQLADSKNRLLGPLRLSACAPPASWRRLSCRRFPIHGRPRLRQHAARTLDEMDPSRQSGPPRTKRASWSQPSFGSYHSYTRESLRMPSAFVKQAGVESVKVERRRAPLRAYRAPSRSRHSVMGHILPHAASSSARLYRVQARPPIAPALLRDARAVGICRRLRHRS